MSAFVMPLASIAPRGAGERGLRRRGGNRVDDVNEVQAQAAWIPPTWEEVVREHSARVYRLAYRLTGNQHDAEDLTQEVFVRVFRSLSSYTPGTFEGWLHRITTNLFLDQVRRTGDNQTPSSWENPVSQVRLRRERTGRAPGSGSLYWLG